MIDEHRLQNFQGASTTTSSTNPFIENAPDKAIEGII